MKERHGSWPAPQLDHADQNSGSPCAYYAALSRLRRHFGDELLSRDRGEYTLTARLADRMDLRVLECLGNPEPIAEALWWHRQYEDDIAHAWLRRLIVETARRL